MTRRDIDGRHGTGLVPARTAKARFSEIVMVCTKCAKRQGLGRRGLRNLLKGELKRRRPERKVRIVETGCLGPCPKRAIAVATVESLARRRILLIDPTLEPGSMVDEILPDFGPKAALGLAPSDPP